MIAALDTHRSVRGLRRGLGSRPARGLMAVTVSMDLVITDLDALLDWAGTLPASTPGTAANTYGALAARTAFSVCPTGARYLRAGFITAPTAPPNGIGVTAWAKLDIVDEHELRAGAARRLDEQTGGTSSPEHFTIFDALYEQLWGANPYRTGITDAFMQAADGDYFIVTEG